MFSPPTIKVGGPRHGYLGTMTSMVGNSTLILTNNTKRGVWNVKGTGIYPKDFNFDSTTGYWVDFCCCATNVPRKGRRPVHDSETPWVRTSGGPPVSEGFWRLNEGRKGLSDSVTVEGRVSPDLCRRRGGEKTIFWDWVQLCPPTPRLSWTDGVERGRREW